MWALPSQNDEGLGGLQGIPANMTFMQCIKTSSVMSMSLLFWSMCFKTPISVLPSADVCETACAYCDHSDGCV